jgi:hypothetical protein
MTATPLQERSSRPRPAKPSPQVWERANEGPCAPLRRSPDEDRDCATSPAPAKEADRCVNCNTALDPVKDADCNVCLPCWKSYRQWRWSRPRTREVHEGASYHEALARDRAPELFAERAATPEADAEAAAERELLRLCFANAKDAAWAQWFHEEVYSRPGGKVAALAFYREWEAQGMARP